MREEMHKSGVDVRIRSCVEKIHVVQDLQLRPNARLVLEKLECVDVVTKVIMGFAEYLDNPRITSGNRSFETRETRPSLIVRR